MNSNVRRDEGRKVHKASRRTERNVRTDSGTVCTRQGAAAGVVGSTAFGTRYLEAGALAE